jgi:hypothetical protein
MEFADSGNCGGDAAATQAMVAETTIVLGEAAEFDLLWSGVSEANYEKMTITVNGVIVATLMAESDGVCQVGSCVMCETLEQTTTVSMLSGSNTITIIATTQDGSFHQGAYYSVQFVAPNCDGDCTACSAAEEADIAAAAADAATAVIPPVMTGGCAVITDKATCIASKVLILTTRYLPPAPLPPPHASFSPPPRSLPLLARMEELPI